MTWGRLAPKDPYKATTAVPQGKPPAPDLSEQASDRTSSNRISSISKKGHSPDPQLLNWVKSQLASSSGQVSPVASH